MQTLHAARVSYGGVLAAKQRAALAPAVVLRVRAMATSADHPSADHPQELSVHAASQQELEAARAALQQVGCCGRLSGALGRRAVALSKLTLSQAVTLPDWLGPALAAGAARGGQGRRAGGAAAALRAALCGGRRAGARPL